MEFNFISFYNDHRNKFFLGLFGKMEGRLVSKPGKLSMAIADNKVKVPQRDKHSNRNTFHFTISIPRIPILLRKHAITFSVSMLRLATVDNVQ